MTPKEWGGIGRPGNFDPTAWWGYRFECDPRPDQLGHKLYCRLWRDGFPTPVGRTAFVLASELSENDNVSAFPTNVFTWARGTEGPVDIQRIHWFYFLAEDGIEVYLWPTRQTFKEREFEFKVTWGMKPAIMLNYKKIMRIGSVRKA